MLTSTPCECPPASGEQSIEAAKGVETKSKSAINSGHAGRREEARHRAINPLHSAAEMFPRASCVGFLISIFAVVIRPEQNFTTIGYAPQYTPDGYNANNGIGFLLSGFWFSYGAREIINLEPISNAYRHFCIDEDNDFHLSWRKSITSLHMKNILPYALSFALLGAALGAASTYALTRQNEKPLLAVDHSSMQMASNSMADGLKGKTGDEFDKAFISQMIEHHEGAVTMAVQARQDARHPEIKAMAEDIISAQTREIAQMKSWQQQWSY